MSAGRTVTVYTLDHGPVTLSEPAWCTGEHEDGLHQVDLFHDSAETALTVDTEHGPVEILAAALTQYPYAPDPAGRDVAVTVLLDGGYHTFRDETSLRLLAAQLVVHAGRLRDLARQMTQLQGGAL